jgi:hypothetical protein
MSAFIFIRNKWFLHQRAAARCDDFKTDPRAGFTEANAGVFRPIFEGWLIQENQHN